MEIAVIAGVAIALGAWLVPWLVPQWRTESVRIRDAARTAEPNIYFHVRTYSGAGFGYALNVQNRGQAEARNARVSLPSLDGVAWREANMPANYSRVINIPLADNASIRTQRTPGAEAVFEFEDRLGLTHRQVLPIVQTPRNDGQFNFGSDDTNVRVERPTIGVREIWRLRNRA